MTWDETRTALRDRFGRQVLQPRPPSTIAHHYRTVVVVLIGVAIFAPLIFQSPSNRFLLNLWLLYSILSTGFYWIFGLGGRFAFSQTVMMALGGYTYAWLLRGLGDGQFLLSLGMSVGITVAFAYAIGRVTIRAKEFYFGVATLAVSQVGVVVFTNSPDFTGPSGSVSGIPVPSLLGRTLRTDDDYFYLFLGLLAIVLLVGIFLERSPLRRRAIAAADNPAVAAVAGVDVLRVQLSLFCLGSAVGAMAGALLGAWTGSLSIESFGIDLSIGIFLMLFIGGRDSLWGPMIGAAIYVALPEVLSGLVEYRTVVYGTLLLVVVVAFPQGIAGGVRDLVARFRRSPNPTRERRPTEAPFLPSKEVERA